MRLTWPAPERNKAPILEVLLRVLPSRGTLLELASGTGQHAIHFARALPGLRYIPSDPDPEHVASIDAHGAASGSANLAPARLLDACAPDWDVPELDAVYAANLVHIAPWQVAEGMFAGVGRSLKPGGVFALYGPFKVGGHHTADSNARFDASLRAQDARWGVRDLEALEELAEAQGLCLRERVAMPANNFTLVFARDARG